MTNYTKIKKTIKILTKREAGKKPQKDQIIFSLNSRAFQSIYLNN